MAMRYEVTIHYRGISNFIVEADNEDEAKEIAQAQYEEGAWGTGRSTDGVVLGNEFEEIDEIAAQVYLPHMTPAA